MSKVRWFAAVLLILADPATAAEWKNVGAANGHGETLSLAIDEAHSYSFECTPDAVLVSETGVTDLLDIRAGGAKVSDGPGATMPDGAAVMALYAGKGDPEFLPATYVPNPNKGWDLSIKLPKRDKRLDALTKTETLSLFTTGFTAAVVIGSAERKMFADFLSRCRS
jgi:hypothetical protein